MSHTSHVLHVCSYSTALQQTPNWHRQLELINLNCSVLHAFPNWCLCCPVSYYCVEMLGCL